MSTLSSQRKPFVSRRRRRTAGLAVLALTVAVTAGLVWVFHTADMPGARTAVFIVTGSIWPLPIALAATIAAGPDMLSVGPVRRLLKNLAVTLMASVVLIPLACAVWMGCASFAPGLLGFAPLMLFFGLGWTLVGLVVVFVHMDYGDVYGGGWAP